MAPSTSAAGAEPSEDSAPLPDVERQVLELRFMRDLTQREIGQRLGYSQMHVSRLLRRALSRVGDAAAVAS